MYPNSSTARNINFGLGDPATVLAQGRTQANEVASNVPTEAQMAEFNNALLQLLRRKQQLGTKQFAQQEFSAREAQANRLSASTPASLIGAAPSVQASARSAQVGALNPTIQSASSSQQTFGEQIRSYGENISQAQQFLKDYETKQDKARAEARDDLNTAISVYGSRAFDIVDPKKVTLAGYDKAAQEVARQTLREQEAVTNAKGGSDLIASQKTAIDNLNSVMSSLDTYRSLYDSLVGRSGINLTGADAGKLSGSYNALLFQIAQAAGTGALQAADREVVEAMIPNPTTISGGASSFFKGGKQGGINAIHEAKKIFQNKLSAILQEPGSSPSVTGEVFQTTPSGVRYTVSK